MVGRCIPCWNSPFLGDMLVFRGVWLVLFFVFCDFACTHWLHLCNFWKHHYHFWFPFACCSTSRQDGKIPSRVTFSKIHQRSKSEVRKNGEIFSKFGRYKNWEEISHFDTPKMGVFVWIRWSSISFWGDLQVLSYSFREGKYKHQDVEINIKSGRPMSWKKLIFVQVNIKKCGILFVATC